MAGDGSIGGGSCTLDFRVWDNATGSKKGPPTKRLRYSERSHKGEGATVKFTFPGGATRNVKLRRGQRVRIQWN